MDHIWVTPIPKIGLWTLSPRFSAVFLPLEPTIEFSTWSAVSPSKSRDFRLYEPAIPFFHLVSGFPHHVTSCEPAIPFFQLVSGLLPEVTSPEVPPALDQSEARIGSHLGPIYYLAKYSKKIKIPVKK